MPICPLCSTRPAKRYCPAKLEKICAVCCGAKREVEIYCPSDCTYLRTGREYESEKRIPDTELQSRSQDFTDAWIYRFSPVLDGISAAIVEEYADSQWLVDNDVIEVLKALRATMRTLSSGIYYESLPEGPVRQSLFRRVKGVLDQMMKPQESIGEDALKVKDATDVLEFLMFAAQMHSSTRPKSRRYLDWIAAMKPASAMPQESPGGLILP